MLCFHVSSFLSPHLSRSPIIYVCVSLYPSAPPALSLSITHEGSGVVTNDKVQGSASQSVTLKCAASGGSGAYSYEWTKGDDTSALTSDITGYTVQEGDLTIDNTVTSQ